MHDSVMDYVDEQLLALDLYKTRPILEIGSRNVNGSLRELFPDEDKYTGIDIRPGSGVDLVGTIDIFFKEGYYMPTEMFPLILCSEMLEHDKFYWKTLAGINCLLVTGGYLILTTRAFNESGCYPMHEIPDYHRFTKDGLLWLLTDLGFQILDIRDDPYMPGVFATCRKP